MRIVALEYHDVVRDDDWDGSGFPGNAAATYKLSVASFDGHLGALERSACRVMTSVTDVVSVEDSTPVILTFDDGGSGYMAAAELLERRDWRGCVFMTTGSIGKPGFLSASDLRALHQRGHTIGTHSRNHPLRLAALSTAAILEEWRSSIADLEDVLGAPVTIGSVPGGYPSRAVAQSAATAGLTTLFTSEPETRVTTIAGCAVRGRYTLRRGDPGEYAARLAGKMPASRVMQWCQWNAKKVAKAVGGRAYLRVRERVIGS